MTHDEFISEAESKLTKANVDEIAKIPGYIHSVLVLSDMRRITFSEQVQAGIRRVITEQSSQMGLALYAGGQWSQMEAIEVAKCWIECFHNTSDSAHLIADTDAQKTDALLEHAHEKASDLVAMLFDPSLEAGQVKRACAWLRENRTGVGIGKPPPSNEPDSIHTGIELLKSKLFGTHNPAKDGAPKEPKPKNKQWPKIAQRKVATLWMSYRANNGTREKDCYEETKDSKDFPDCIKNFEDFQKCKEAAEKTGFIERLRPKRGKKKGKARQ